MIYEDYRGFPFLVQVDGSVYSPFFEQYFLSIDSFQNHVNKYMDFMDDLALILGELEEIAMKKTKAIRQTAQQANFSPTSETRQE